MPATYDRRTSAPLAASQIGSRALPTSLLWSGSADAVRLPEARSERSWPLSTIEPMRAVAPPEPPPTGTPSDPEPLNWSGVAVEQAPASAAPGSVSDAAALAEILEGAPDLVYRSDASGRLVYLNRAGRSALGLAPLGPLDGLTLTSLHPAEDREVVRNEVIPLALREGMWSGLLTVRFSAGGDRPVSARIQAHRSADGQLQGFSAILRDESERVAILADLERARLQAQAENLAKTRFLARMSHELRTPLTSVLGFTDFLREDPAVQGLPADRLECLDLISRNGRYLVELMNDLLDLSKVELGEVVPVLSMASPQGIAGEVVALLRHRATARGLSLELVASEGLPAAVETDPLRLRQILINLVGNAIRFTGQGGVRVELGPLSDGTSGAARAIRIDVIDTGPGLSPDQVARLGESFYQAHPDRPRDELGGTGLGLAISWQLAGRLGAALDVDSQPGRGSRFRLTLPIRPQGEEPGRATGTGSAPESASTPGPTAAAGLSSDGLLLGNVRLDCRILLADDVLSSRRAIGLCLELAGAEAVSVGNGLDAIEAALTAEREGRPFDVLLLDIQMPVLDGPGAIRSLRQRGYRRPVLALTAEANPQDHCEYRALGFDDCTSKPIDWSRLVDLIRACRGGGASAGPGAGPIPGNPSESGA